MKKSFFLFLLFSVFTASTTFASFPVNKKNVDKQVQVVDDNQTHDVSESQDVAGFKVISNDEEALSPAVAAASDSNQLVILLLLWLFLAWPLAVHRWYAKKPAGWNILFIVTFAGFGIWAIVDLVNILTGNFMD